ncbi:hypothetical protein ABIB51_002043 [Arthrobacter sp. UYCu712]
MTDRCKIERPAGPGTLNPVTNKLARNSDPVYPLDGEDGRCEVKQSEGQATHPNSGEYRFTLQGSVVKLPVGAGPVKVNDVITMTHTEFNPALAGTVYRVVELSKQSAASAQRVRVEEVTG